MRNRVLYYGGNSIFADRKYIRAVVPSVIASFSCRFRMAAGAYKVIVIKRLGNKYNNSSDDAEANTDCLFVF